MHINTRLLLREYQFSFEHCSVILNFFGEVKKFFFVKMEAFNLLKQACYGLKRVVAFNELPLGEYPVTEFILTNTRYGETLRVDLGDMYVYLPQRFARGMTAEKVVELNRIPQILRYTGRDPTRHNLYVFFCCIN